MLAFIREEAKMMNKSVTKTSLNILFRKFLFQYLE